MRLKKLPLYAIVGLVLIYLVLPTFVVIPISLSSSLYMRFPPPGWSVQWYHRYFSSTEWTRATLMSLKVATLTTALSLLLGTPAAWALVRRSIHGRRVINAIVMWPLAVPVIALSLGLYKTLLSLGLLGSV
jgi:ABC-type spermidine/putrescine transport system permease subunit II